MQVNVAKTIATAILGTIFTGLITWVGSLGASISGLDKELAVVKKEVEHAKNLSEDIEEVKRDIKELLQRTSKDR